MTLANDHNPEASIATLRGDVVRYRNRNSRELVVEKAPGLGALRWLYTRHSGKVCLRLVARHKLFSDLYGWWQQRAFTRRDIRPFVERYGVDASEIEHPLDHYPNFNEFFIRRLRAGARPFSAKPDILCSPADGKALVYPHLGTDIQLPIKGCHASIESLLGEAADPSYYINGAALVVRLAPYDYHRFHFPDSGTAGATQLLSGHYHSVNPIALQSTPDIFCLNKRAITEIETDSFGRIAYIEVGALNVASIVQTHVEGPVERGDEKGYFQFGGSTIVLLFAAGHAAFDADLIGDSCNGLEVHVRTGEAVGRCA
ncbi:MAG: phosphatidylserine decarboxylase [Planctomycetota bacterium]|jgi:phosphatidylserine decarboxylase